MMTEMLLDREASYHLAKVRFRIPRGISLKASAGSNRLRGRAKHHSDMIGRPRVNAATGLMRRHRHPNGAGSGGGLDRSTASLGGRSPGFQKAPRGARGIASPSRL